VQVLLLSVLKDVNITSSRPQIAQLELEKRGKRIWHCPALERT